MLHLGNARSGDKHTGKLLLVPSQNIADISFHYMFFKYLYVKALSVRIINILRHKLY